MTGAAALAYFALEVIRASGALGIPAPGVRAINIHERHPLASATVVAYVNPGEGTILITWSALWNLGQRDLRCIARHEAAHVALGHSRGSRDVVERAEMEAAANEVIARRWHEPANCGM